MPVVKFFAGLRQTAGSKETFVEAGSLREALDELVVKIPEMHAKVWDGSRLRPYVNVTVNGQTLTSEEELNRPLEPGDTIAIFPPIAGG